MFRKRLTEKIKIEESRDSRKKVEAFLWETRLFEKCARKRQQKAFSCVIFSNQRNQALQRLFVFHSFEYAVLVAELDKLLRRRDGLYVGVERTNKLTDIAA